MFRTAVPASLLCLWMVACDFSAPPSQDWYGCINHEQMPSPGSGGEKVGVISQPLYASTKSLWGQTQSPGDAGGAPITYPRKIPVCWLPSAYAKPEYDLFRGLVRHAIEETWQKALDIPGIPESYKISFVGWDKCQDGVHAVRLDVSDERPWSVYGTKTYRNAGSSVKLNFEFAVWNSDACRDENEARPYCISWVAVHEFGHVLGFAHEQNRPDTPTSICHDAPQGDDGDLMIGPWDLDSVMNYCDPRWDNDGRLSMGDIHGVQMAYYPWMMSASCDIPTTPVTQANTQELFTRKNPAVEGDRVFREPKPGSPLAPSNPATSAVRR